MAKTILAIGGHIGDACLTAGGVMASNAVEGGKNYTLALTAGERGNPAHMTKEEYRVQKIKEAENFMALMNGEAFVLEYEDGELPNNEKVRMQVAEIIVKLKPDIIITHWRSQMHKDHNNTHYIVQDARFIASVVGTQYGRHYDLWCKALHEHWFVMNSKDFAYYDYYTSLARCRGALCKKQYAECFNIFEYSKKVVKDQL